MIRTQLQLDRETYEALRARAFAEHKSLSALAREILSAALLPGPERGTGFGFRFVGIGRGGDPDVSGRHDEVLDEEPRW